MKRRTKSSRTLIEVVRDQRRAIQTLAKYIEQIENELKLRDIAFEKFNDDAIRRINSAIRAKATKNDKGEWVIPKTPQRTVDEIIKDINIEAELLSRKYFHINRPNNLL